MFGITWVIPCSYMFLGVLSSLESVPHVNFTFLEELNLENPFRLQLLNRSPTILKPNNQLKNTHLNNCRILIILVAHCTFRIVPILDSKFQSHFKTIFLFWGFTCQETCVKKNFLCSSQESTLINW